MLRAQKGSGSIRKRGRNSYEGRLMVNGTRTSVYGRTKLIVQEKRCPNRESQAGDQQ